MADDDLTIRLRAVGARPFKRDVDRSARSIDNLGDQAGQAARKMRSLNRQTGNARLSLGPLSIKAKHAGIAFGAAALLTGKASTALLGFSEATATVLGGAGAAGGVGLTALAQGMGTVKLATAGLTDALGGNEEALAKLNPAQARFVAKLQEMQPLLDTLRASASGGLLGGAGKGLTAASKNFGVLNKIVRNTSGTLGGLAAKAGKGLGSKRAGADLASMGATNVRIIDSLGNATLSLASAVGNVLVEAGPLSIWLADAARKGAALTDTWTTNARATGRLADFFARARTNLSQLGSILGHTGAGIINLFGSQDVDGTKTLASLDRITARFEVWSKSPAVRGGLGEAIINQIPKAAGGVASALAKLLGAAAPQAAEIFLKAFVNADAWGKALIGGVLAKRLGLGKIASKAVMGAMGGKGGVVGKLMARGATPGNPLFVVDVSQKPGKDWLKKAGPAAGSAAAAKAAARKAAAKALLRGTGSITTLGAIGQATAGPGKPLQPGFQRRADAKSRGTTPQRSPLFEILSGNNPFNDDKPRTRQRARTPQLPESFFRPHIHNVLQVDSRVVYEANKKHADREAARK